MGVYIPNMEKPKKGEVIAFDGEYAVYTDDDMQVHRYPLIEIDLVRCGECKHYGFKETDRGGFPCCTNVIGATPYRMPTDFCSYGERRADEHTD